MCERGSDSLTKTSDTNEPPARIRTFCKDPQFFVQLFTKALALLGFSCYLSDQVFGHLICAYRSKECRQCTEQLHFYYFGRNVVNKSLQCNLYFALGESMKWSKSLQLAELTL